MSAAGFLKKLLDGANVAWVPLGEVLIRTKGTSITAAKMKQLHKDGAPIKIFAGGKTVAYVDFADLPEKDIKHEPSIIVKSRGNIEFEFYDRPFSHKNEMWAYKADSQYLDIKYFFHFLKLHEPYFQSLGGRMQMPQISTPHTDKFLVPIPCPDDSEKSLAIQRKIARILDTFTELASELAAELDQRKKQYNHYRDQLLAFDEDEVTWKTLGEVADFRRGTAITKKQTTPGSIPVVANGPAPTYSHGQHNRKGETVVIARSGAYAGYVSFWSQPIFLTDAFSVHPAPNLLLPKFVFYLLRNKQSQLHDLKKGAGVPHVRVKEVEQYTVPIPPLAQQARIVAILDKFDMLTTSLTEGLPREIELREKQYAYYRNQLLSFPKPDAEAA